MRPLRFAFTPTYNRPAMYAELRANVVPQVDEFITIAHGPEAQAYATGITIPFDAPLPDLSIQWNLGLDKAHELANGRPYFVAGFNDDALVAPDWFDRMVDAMDRDGSAGASTPRQPGKMRSIFGGAWVIRGGLGIRMSGATRWFYTDDEIQKLCQRAGGFTIVPGVHAVNRLANLSTRASRELQAINSQDWPKFKALYGMPESPWDNTPYHVIISAPSGEHPTHIIDTLDGRDYTVMVDGWETEQLAAAAELFSRFCYVKESVRLFPGFWEAIDSEPGSCWFFPHPSSYMGIFDSRSVLRMLSRLSPTRDKEDSIRNESAIHRTVRWKSIWPEVTDANALRVEVVNGAPELVIGNAFIEKLKGSARCAECSRWMRGSGLCDHYLARFLPNR